MGGVTARFKTWLRDLYRRLMLREAEIEESREGVGKDAFLSGLSDSWYFHSGVRRTAKHRRDRLGEQSTPGVVGNSSH